jgi:hypothetical protein
MSCVQVFNSATYLNHESSDLGERQAFSLLQHIGQGSVWAHVQDDVCARVERKCAVEGDNVRM